MADLGEWGRARRDLDVDLGVREPDTFRFYGEQFVIPDRISDLVSMDFVADMDACQKQRDDAEARQSRAREARDRAVGRGQDAAVRVADAELEAADRDLIEATNLMMRSMRDYVRSCMPDEGSWRRFNGVCRREGVDTSELMEVCARVFSTVAGRPTSRPGGSSGGPSTTGDGLMGGSGSLGGMGGGSRPVMDSPPAEPAQPVSVPEVPVEAVVVPLSANERAKREILAGMVPVDELLSQGSGG